MGWLIGLLVLVLVLLLLAPFMLSSRISQEEPGRDEEELEALREQRERERAWDAEEQVRRANRAKWLEESREWGVGS